MHSFMGIMLLFWLAAVACAALTKPQPPPSFVGAPSLPQPSLDMGLSANYHYVHPITRKHVHLSYTNFKTHSRLYNVQALPFDVVAVRRLPHRAVALTVLTESFDIDALDVLDLSKSLYLLVGREYEVVGDDGLPQMLLLKTAADATHRAAAAAAAAAAVAAAAPTFTLVLNDCTQAHLEDVIESGSFKFSASHAPEEHYTIYHHNQRREDGGALKRRLALDVYDSNMEESFGNHDDNDKRNVEANGKKWKSFWKRMWGKVKKILVGAWVNLKKKLALVIDILTFIFTGLLELSYEKKQSFEFDFKEDLSLVASDEHEGEQAAEVAIVEGAGFYCDNCKGSIEFAVKLEASFEKYRLMSYEATLGGQADLTINSHLGASVEIEKAFEHALITMKSNPWVFVIGPIPFHVQLFMPLKLTGMFSASAGARIGGDLCLRGNVLFGVNYVRKRGVKYIRDVNLQSHGEIGKINAKVTATARLGLNFDLILRIDLLGGPYVNLYPFVELFAEYNTDFGASQVGSLCGRGEHGVGLLLNGGVSASVGAKLTINTSNIFPGPVDKVIAIKDKVEGTFKKPGLFGVDAGDLNVDTKFKKTLLNKKWPLLRGCHLFDNSIDDLINFRGKLPSAPKSLSTGLTFDGRAVFSSKRDGGRRRCRRRYVNDASISLQIVDVMQYNSTSEEEQEQGAIVEHTYQVVLTTTAAFDAGECYTQTLYELLVDMSSVALDDDDTRFSITLTPLTGSVDDPDEVEYGDCSFDKDFAGSEDDYNVYKRAKSFSGRFLSYPHRLSLTSDDGCIHTVVEAKHRQAATSCAAAFGDSRGACWPLPLTTSPRELSGWEALEHSDAISVESSQMWFIKGEQSAMLKFGPSRLYEDFSSQRVAVFGVDFVGLSKLAEREATAAGATVQASWRRWDQNAEILKCGKVLALKLLYNFEYETGGADGGPTSLRGMQQSGLRASLALVFRNKHQGTRVFRHSGFDLSSLGLYSLNFNLSATEWMSNTTDFFVDDDFTELEKLWTWTVDGSEELLAANDTVASLVSDKGPRRVHWSADKTALSEIDQLGTFLEQVLLIFEWNDDGYTGAEFDSAYVFVDSLELSPVPLNPPAYACVKENLAPMYVDVADVCNSQNTTLAAANRFALESEVLRVLTDTGAKTCVLGDETVRFIRVVPLQSSDSHAYWIARSAVSGAGDVGGSSCDYAPLFSLSFNNGVPYNFRLDALNNDGDDGDDQSWFKKNLLYLGTGVGVLLLCCCMLFTVCVVAIIFTRRRRRLARRNSFLRSRTNSIIGGDNTFRHASERELHRSLSSKQPPPPPPPQQQQQQQQQRRRSRQATRTASARSMHVSRNQSRVELMKQQHQQVVNPLSRSIK